MANGSTFIDHLTSEFGEDGEMAAIIEKLAEATPMEPSPRTIRLVSEGGEYSVLFDQDGDES